MKVLYIITNGNLGGAQVHLRDLISCLPDTIKVHVIMGERLWLWDELIKRSACLYHVGTLVPPISMVDDIKTIFCLIKIINKVRPDLIHCHSSKAGFLGRLAGKICRVPVVFTAHGWAFTEGVSAKKRMLYRGLERMAAKWTRKIICVSEYDRQLGIVSMPESKDKLVTIHNGVKDTARLHTPACHCAPNGRLRLVMVARFSQPKDQAGLLQAVAFLKKQAIRFYVTFIGEGPDLVKAQKLADTLELSEDVQFLGSRLDVDKILAGQDVFVLISNWEGLPISILEAMQQGLLVIASDVGGVCEAVAAGETGFLIPRGDLGGLVQRLREINADTNLRVTMGANGRKRFSEFFRLATMQEKTIAVYKAAIEKQQVSW